MLSDISDYQVNAQDWYVVSGAIKKFKEPMVKEIGDNFRYIHCINNEQQKY
jgi:hypothetical protein